MKIKPARGKTWENQAEKRGKPVKIKPASCKNQADKRKNLQESSRQAGKPAKNQPPALERVREAHALKFGCVRLGFAKDFLPGFLLVIFWSAGRFLVGADLGCIKKRWGNEKRFREGFPVKIVRVNIGFAREFFSPRINMDLSDFCRNFLAGFLGAPKGHPITLEKAPYN